MPQNPYFNQFMNPQMPNNFNALRQSNDKNFQQNQFLKCRPVSSKEEAMACQIDLDGSLWVFADIGNGKMYTKQINTDGTAIFKSFVEVQEPSPIQTETQYVTKDQFNKVINTLAAAIHGTNPVQQSTGPTALIDFQ